MTECFHVFATGHGESKQVGQYLVDEWAADRRDRVNLATRTEHAFDDERGVFAKAWLIRLSAFGDSAFAITTRTAV